MVIMKAARAAVTGYISQGIRLGLATKQGLDASRRG